MSTTSLTSKDRPYKRPLDVVILVVAHIVFLPVWVALWALIPLAIWLDDRGPVFYRQQRMGRRDRVFTVLKFRSLVKDADRVVRPWNVPRGPMVTRVGKILRLMALDELPQVLNILQGDMSFIGPRAMPVGEYERVVKTLPELNQRLSVRPGLTGLAQVRANASRDVKQKLKYDLEYIERMSLWLDLTLLVKSVRNTLLAKWEPPPSGNVEDKATAAGNARPHSRRG